MVFSIKYKESNFDVKYRARINDYVWQDIKWSRYDLGASCNSFMGQVVTDFLWLINADLRQNIPRTLALPKA